MVRTGGVAETYINMHGLGPRVFQYDKRIRTRLSRKQFAKVGAVSDGLTPLELAHTVPIVGVEGPWPLLPLSYCRGGRGEIVLSF